jgi:hypothetical protein
VLTRVLRALHLRFPALFVILFVLTVADWIVPDPLPFLDEIVLAVLTAIFGLWKDRRAMRRGVDGETSR